MRALAIAALDTLSPADYRHWFAAMCPQRQRRVAGFRWEADRQRSIAGEMLARQLLSGPLGLPAEEIPIAYTPQGKPYVEGAEIFFSVSHSGRLAVCVCDSGPVGVDVEAPRAISPRLPDYLCTEDEKAFLEAGPGERDLRFLQIWTFKEAYFKCTGVWDPKHLSYLAHRGQCQEFRLGRYVIQVYGAAPEPPVLESFD